METITDPKCPHCGATDGLTLEGAVHDGFSFLVFPTQTCSKCGVVKHYSREDLVR